MMKWYKVTGATGWQEMSTGEFKWNLYTVIGHAEYSKTKIAP